MDLFSKTLQNISQILGWVTAIAVIALIPFAVKAGWVLLFRQANADLEKLLAQADRELKQFRTENEALTAKVKVLVERLAEADNKLTKQAAMLYGKQRYIARLEKLCRRNQLDLPPRDEVPEENDE